MRRRLWKATAIYPGQKLKRRDKAYVSNAAVKTSLCYAAESGILFGNERVVMPYKEARDKDDLELIYLKPRTNRVLLLFPLTRPSFTASLMPTPGTEAWRKRSEPRRFGRQTLLRKNLLMMLLFFFLRPYLDGRRGQQKVFP